MKIVTVYYTNVEYPELNKEKSGQKILQATGEFYGYISSIPLGWLILKIGGTYTYFRDATILRLESKDYILPKELKDLTQERRMEKMWDLS